VLGLRRPHSHGRGQTLLANSTAGPLHKNATD
jgi:hypothetical protein